MNSIFLVDIVLLSFLFLLASVLVICDFQGIYSFHLAVKNFGIKLPTFPNYLGNVPSYPGNVPNYPFNMYRICISVSFHIFYFGDLNFLSFCLIIARGLWILLIFKRSSSGFSDFIWWFVVVVVVVVFHFIFEWFCSCVYYFLTFTYQPVRKLLSSGFICISKESPPDYL